MLAPFKLHKVCSADAYPHLTLARDYQPAVPEADSPPEFILIADRFALYESHKGQYRVVAEWPLEGGS
jgi:2'-5' RNA ligase